jgi:hypothetical protein
MLSATPLDSTAPSRGNAELAGRVTDQNGAPVPGATVAVQGAADTAKTGADGKFRLVGLPSGTRGIYVRKIGFSPGGAAVDLTTEKPVEVAFRLIKANPVLEAVKIEGKYESALKKNGYADRKRMGMGRYLGPKDIERLQPQSFSSIFHTLPGFTVNAGQFGSTITYRGKGCVTFYVDGIQQFNVDAAQLENLVRPEQVMAVETYSNTAAPMEYRPPGQSCAIVLVWTNRTIR